MNNSFLESASQGRNEFWRYLVTTLAMIFVAVIVQVFLSVAAMIVEGTTDLNQFSPITFLLIAMVPFGFTLLVLWGGVRLLHGRSFRSLITPASRIRWGRIAFSGAVWFFLAILSDVVLAVINPDNYAWTFDLKSFLPYFVLALILVPIQTTTEELIFRGYLAQGISRLNKRAIFPLVIPSLVFMLLHSLNPEVGTYGILLTMPFYLGMGLLLGWVTLRSEGMEHAIGLHAANNLYAAFIVTFPSSALPSPALFTMQKYDPVIGLIGFVVISAVYIGILYGFKRRWLAPAAVTVALLAVLIVPGGKPASARSYYAERFDVNIQVMADGVLEITETVEFQFEGGPYTYAFRELALNELDRLEVLQASMDGTPLPQGSQAGQVEIKSDSDPVEVTWHFAPTQDASRVFTLTYRVFGNVRQTGGLDRLYWQAVPEEHEYAIQSSTIRVMYPPSLEPSGEPGLDFGNAQMEKGPGEVVFTLQDIPADQAVVVDVRFPGGSLIDQPPAWQAIQLERGRQSRAALPLGGIAGMVALVSSLFGVEFYRRRHSPEKAMLYPPGVVTSPPDSISPGMAGKITGISSSGIFQAYAIVLDFARRGLVHMEENEGTGLFKVKDFQVTRVNETVDLMPHEQVVYDFLFITRKGVREQTSLRDFASHFGAKASEFDRALQADLISSDLVIPEQIKKRTQLYGWGLTSFVLGFLLVLFGGISIGVALNNMARLGLILLGAGIGVLGGGIGAVVVASAWNIYSVRGQESVQRWLAFRNYIKDAVKAETSLQPEWLERYLPYAVAFNLSERWVKAYKEHGMDTSLPWLVSATGGYADSAMVSAVIVTSAASSSGAGSAGGGGGGSSGAG